MMNGNDMAQTQVGSDKVLAIYQQRLMAAIHELALTTAYIQQLQEQSAQFQVKIQLMAEEIARLKQPDLLEIHAREAVGVAMSALGV